jgi:hypothetical protein
MYTQRGRLTQDDAAREIAKQRAVGSEHTWQPVQKDHEPRLSPESAGQAEDATEPTPDERAVRTPARMTAKPSSPKKTAARRTPTKTAGPAMRGNAKTARATKAKTSSANRRKNRRSGA